MSLDQTLKVGNIRLPEEQAVRAKHRSWVARNAGVVVLALLSLFLGYGIGRAAPSSVNFRIVCRQNGKPFRAPDWPGPERLPIGSKADYVAGRSDATGSVNASAALKDAVEVMQSKFFEVWLGTWPSAIDWTAAVMATHVTATIRSFAEESKSAFATTYIGIVSSWTILDNFINRAFTQTVGYYFGQDDFGIRLQAYDDMLWVVLGWIESIRLVEVRSGVQYESGSSRISPQVESDEWYGTQYVPAFAHRSRIFFELARKGWDTRLCGGGMIWDSHSEPYKNAITNELFISAAVGMYLYHPGDPIDSPFLSSSPNSKLSASTKWTEASHGYGQGGPYADVYLQDAIRAYDWLRNSSMTNNVGLFVDGFHIHNYGVNGSIGTGECDERNEMVYTYNQGVLLSGLRGLWEATGNIDYLKDGHHLIRNVIDATGWDLDVESHAPPFSAMTGKWKWQGLGRAGILEEACDASGGCDQNGQTFKGIFFHHLTQFCEPLPEWSVTPGKTYGADKGLRMMHRQSCREYAPWVDWNARAALKTRDTKGVFGMWWSVGVAKDETELQEMLSLIEDRQSPELRKRDKSRESTKAKSNYKICPEVGNGAYCVTDPNERGRGRTVETQGGGVAVVRATWKLSLL